MAENVRTPSVPPSRKTLEEIRREIDAEFLPPEADTPLDETSPEDNEATLQALRAPQRPRWRSYLKVALFATLVVEVFFLGYLLGSRHGGESVASTVSRLTARDSRPVSRATPVMAASAPQATAEAAPTSQPAPAETPASQPAPGDALSNDSPSTAIPSESHSRLDATDRVAAEPVHRDLPPAREAPPRVPRSVVQAPARVRSGPTPARQAPPAATQAPTPVAMMVKEPGDWVESQSQLRAALREWLAVSGHRSPSVDPESADVILGPDGRTAKTRVLMHLAGHSILREQRWVRGSNGWSILDDRQVQPPRP